MTHLAATGYCFGAREAISLACPTPGTKSAVDAIFIAHPTTLDASAWSGMRVPVSIAASEHDMAFPAEKRHAVEDVLAGASAKSVEEGGKIVPWQVALYSGVYHGFAVRGNMEDPLVKFAKESATVQAVRWFDAFL